MEEIDRQAIRVMLRALQMRQADTNPSGRELWVHADGSRVTLTWGDTLQWGVMFGDGSVRHPWNGSTARTRAEQEAKRLRGDFPRDTFLVVCRHGNGPWRQP